ncbi:MAG TPA: MFS transporter [Candidatus Dormibacteraeota bacterium]
MEASGRSPSAARRDYLLLIATRIIRAFGFGFAGILVAVHLQARMFSPAEIGVALAIGLATASLSGLVSASASARFGRRRTLSALGVLMAVSGLDLALATQHWLLILGGLTGMMGIAGTDNGPFLPVEQAMLTQAATRTNRNRAFARYSLTGALGAAAGALVATVGTSPSRTTAFFIGFSLLGLLTAGIPLLVSSEVEAQPARTFGTFKPLLGLGALFAVDSLGTGLVSTAVLVYWLTVRFGATPAVLGPAFGLMSLLVALSFELSGRLADRIGLVNTMVFTHLPSNLLLLLVPFAPKIGFALAILVIRSTLVSMDQPARQAYVVSIVPSNERAGALAFTGAIRGLASAAGPVITGAAIQTASFAFPFFTAGVLKAGYDVALYFGFRRRRGDHEADGLL